MSDPRFVDKNVQRIWVVLVSIILSLVMISLTIRVASAAPNFLPQSTLSGPGGEIPAPGQKYRTRTGWLLAAFDEYYNLNVKAAIAEAMQVEMKAFVKLSKRDKEKYYLNLIQDTATMEVMALENGWYSGVVFSAVVDFMVGSKVGGFADAKKLGKISSAVLGTSTTASAGIALGGARNQFNSTKGGFRQMLLTQYLKSHCGCTQPNPSLKPPGAWDDIVLPRANLKYQTALGRILGSANKTHTGIAKWVGNAEATILNSEIKNINHMRKKQPAKLAAYLTHFAYDIETIQEEYLSDARATTISSVFGTITLAALSSGVGMLYPPAGLMMSAGFTGASTWAGLSKEQQIMLTLANMRSNVLRELDSLPGKCGCVKESKLIVLDASSSMSKDQRMEKAKQSIHRVMASMKGKIEVGLIVFYDCGRIEVVQEFTTDPKLIGIAVDPVKPTGGTALYAAVTTAEDYMKKHASGKKRSSVLLSDGKDTCR